MKKMKVLFSMFASFVLLASHNSVSAQDYVYQFSIDNGVDPTFYISATEANADTEVIDAVLLGPKAGYDANDFDPALTHYGISFDISYSTSILVATLPHGATTENERDYCPPWSPGCLFFDEPEFPPHGGGGSPGGGGTPGGGTTGEDDYGTEIPEERDYYPYWHPTPYQDLYQSGPHGTPKKGPITLN